MAVGQIPDGNSEQQEGVEPCCSEESEGPVTGYQDMNRDSCGVVNRYNQRRRRNKCDESDSLSDIDDAEISGYLNTKEEFIRKRTIWKLLNGNYKKGKKQKRTTEAKKSTFVNKADKTTKEVESQRRSSRINFDALKIMNDELNQDSETDQIIRADSSTPRTEDKRDEHTNDECFDFSELY